MATYDGAAFVTESIDSVLAQTHRELELIVVDDSSTDATPEIVAGMARRDPRVMLVRRTATGGPCLARAVGFERSRGELLCWLDQDDVWSPTKVAEQVELLRFRPDVGLVYTYFEAFDGGTGAALDWPDGRRDIQGDVLGALFVEGCFIGSLTVMFRREALAKRGLRLRVRDFSFGDDYDLWLGIALDWQVARIPRVLARYRRHSGNESARLERGNADLQRVGLLREFLAAHADAAGRLGRRRRIGLARHLWLAARAENRRGQRKAAWVLAARSAALAPSVAVRALALALLKWTPSTLTRR
jgi:GT2 family glycosyltransferase